MLGGTEAHSRRRDEQVVVVALTIDCFRTERERERAEVALVS